MPFDFRERDVLGIGHVLRFNERAPRRGLRLHRSGRFQWTERFNKRMAGGQVRRDGVRAVRYLLGM